MNICTIIARNYAAHARVLAESFREIHPDGTCSVLVIDDPSGYIDPAGEPFELVTIEEIGLPDAERMAASYDVMEFSTAVKPWLLRHLLHRPGVDAVAYLDPDIRIFSSIEEIDRRAREHGVVLTPHFTSPLPRDNRKPGEEDILIAGTYNLGFIGLGVGETADALLDWWSERLETHCLNDPGEGRFVDQRWIDLAPGLWPGIDILRDTAFNIAYWNLPTRTLEDDGEGGYRVDGEQLRFFHFSGFDPRHPERLSKHQNRIEIAPGSPLARICREYGAELLEHGFEEARDWPYGWEKAGNGVVLDRAARRAYREGVEAEEFSGSVFSEEGAERFVAYLSEPGPSGDRVNRYAQALWDSRPDFRQIFPNIEGDGGPAFTDWLRRTADDTGVAAELLPPRSPSPAGPQPEPGEIHTEPGVNLLGYLSSERGVGEAARKVHAALLAGGIPTAGIDSPADPEEMSDALGQLTDGEHPYDFNLLCVNADMTMPVAAALGERYFAERHSAGLWFWEVTRFPEQWQGAFGHLDEVWTASEYIGRALRAISPIPVHVVRLPITPPDPEPLSRAELGLPEGFCFLFVFDYRSVFRRKNPLGIVTAFKAAFEPGAGPSLVIKSVCGDEFPEQREELRAAVRDRPEIHLVEETVPAAVKDAMIASCDCFVSLHRSEGLGLTMAEAMYFGRPVIATGYSGNLDFMTEQNSFLIPHTMVPIGDDAPPYPAEGEWAEPDLDRAAALMRRAFDDPVAAAERGRRAAADIRRTHSLKAAGEVIAARVAEARRQRLIGQLRHPGTATRRPGTQPRGRDHLEHLLGSGIAPSKPSSGRVRRSAKQVYRRLLRPYSSYQQAVNGKLTQSLDEIRALLTEALEVESTIDTAQGASLREVVDEVSRNRERINRADELVTAAGAKPYMADDRISPRTHPALGETIGFRTAAGKGNGYRGFEDLFRGSEEMIRDRQRVYLDLVADRGPVFDAGCGRGELLDLLAERGIEFKAVDFDPSMVARCHEKGHTGVEQADLLEFLERQPPASLGTIFSAQVIEHVPYEQLKRFFELSLSRLRPGGLLIAETVNPHSAAALKAFWVDPTHMHPLFPEVVLELCELAGYASGDVFAPLGDGDWELDRTRAGEYAVVAAAPGG